MIGGQPYRGFTEPTFPRHGDAADDVNAVSLLAGWRGGVDAVLDQRAQAEDTSIYAHRSCDPCQGIRRDWRAHGRWIEGSYWRPLRDVVPTNVLLDMSIAELHAIHHLGEGGYGDAIVFAGIRVLTHYFTSQDTVPRQDMNDRLTAQVNQHWAAMEELKATAREQAHAAVAERLREAQVRVANVEALTRQAFGRKTMRYDEVRAAIDWRTGDPIPELTLEAQRRERELHAPR